MGAGQGLDHVRDHQSDLDHHFWNLHIDPDHEQGLQGQGLHQGTDQDLDRSPQDIAQGHRDQGHTPEAQSDTVQGLHHPDGGPVLAVQEGMTGGLHHLMDAEDQGHLLLPCTEAGQGHLPHMITTDRNGIPHHLCMETTEDPLVDQVEGDPLLHTTSILLILTTGMS